MQFFGVRGVYRHNKKGIVAGPAPSTRASRGDTSRRALTRSTSLPPATPCFFLVARKGERYRSSGLEQLIAEGEL
jgi:hypothetical protein